MRKTWWVFLRSSMQWISHIDQIGQYTLSIAGASPRDFRYAVNSGADVKVIDEFGESILPKLIANENSGTGQRYKRIGAFLIRNGARYINEEIHYPHATSAFF